MINIEKLVRRNVAEMHPYSSARDEYQGKTGIFLDANENPFGLLNRYPDPRHNELRELLSLRKGIDKERIFLGNGSDEIIDLSFRIFCNPGSDKAMIFSPTYGMYEVAAAMNDISVIDIPLLPDFAIDIKSAESHFSDSRLKLLFICSPNNPTGNCFDEKDVLFLVKNFPGIVIIDEAYIDFASGPSLIRYTGDYPNLLVMQTFSKAFGLASVRIGIAYSGYEIMKYLFRMKPPYNISTINQKAALEKMKETSVVNEEVALIRGERERLQRSLAGINIVRRVFSSEANFLLTEVENPDLVYKCLVEDGIIVRNRNSVVPGCLRITVGKPAENDRLIEALKNIQI